MQIFKFPESTSSATLAEVGGKGLSLIKGSESGLPVPPGFVLSVEFFRPWLEQLKTTSEWQHFITASTEQMKEACTALKKASDGLKFTAEQKNKVDECLNASDDAALFAVRSSSPEEDLEGASFAGGYETILGVNKKSIESAVLRAFASCLDFRVAAYKSEHGFDVSSPKIAVVIQRQIASDVAGVGFSINPLSNNFDEVVINANFGLGETVVGGLATPDTYRVNKFSRAIAGRELGAKETSIWLEANGGTREKPAGNRDQFSLSDQQILQLSDLISKVEELYGKPIDTEWAFCGPELFLLQARPITAFVPLAPNMMTMPGERKNLYLDVTIVVQGLYKPLSAMGTNMLRLLANSAGKEVLGVSVLGEVNTSILIIQDGRLFLNLSNLLAIFGKEKVVKVITQMDPTSSRALTECNDAEYTAHKDGFFHPPFHLIAKLPELAVHLVEARLLPQHAEQHAQREINKFKPELHDFVEHSTLPFWDLAEQTIGKTFKFIFKTTIPLFVASRIALEHLKSILKDASEEQLSNLERALPHNVTTEMGLALNHLAQQEPESNGYKQDWKKFIDLYGHRGPIELDIASPRYRDLPELLIEQIETLRPSSHAQDNPQARFDKAQMQRHDAYEQMSEQVQEHSGWIQLKRFQSLYRVYETLAGYREMHKYLLIFAFDQLRHRLLWIAKELVNENKLDDKEQVFDLTLDDLKAHESDSSYNLREAAIRNRKFSNALAAVPSLPALFDSRGMILRPIPPLPREGEVVGTPISPGVTRGRIKVLHEPDEKPLLRGEILVAKATDPGWTPLFVNAGAVILEIGGMLQHGALVAREYGLPCVSGIQNATTLWQDGTLVEVDGSAGIIREIKE